MSCALPDYTAPCPNLKKKKKKCFAVFVFSDRDVKMLVKCLQTCAHVFINRPQNCAQTSLRSCAGLRPNFSHSRSKLCPIMCRSRTKLCPNFGRSHARLCPISFAPCPFPNLAGTLGTEEGQLEGRRRGSGWDGQLLNESLLFITFSVQALLVSHILDLSSQTSSVN